MRPAELLRSTAEHRGSHFHLDAREKPGSHRDDRRPVAGCARGIPDAVDRRGPRSRHLAEAGDSADATPRPGRRVVETRVACARVPDLH